MSKSMTTSAAAQTKKPMAPAKTPSTATPSAMPMEKIAQRAYEKWLMNGCPHGCDQQHWYEAEMEIRTEMTKDNGSGNRR